MTCIFAHTDDDGDVVRVFDARQDDPHWPVGLVVGRLSGAVGTADLSPAAITRLRTVLAEFDPTERQWHALPEIEVGKEYRLLPGARLASASVPEKELAGVTRVRVDKVADEDGDVAVTTLDGPNVASREWVDAKYLAPLDQPAHTQPAAGLAAASASARRTAALAEAAAILSRLDWNCDEPLSDALICIADYLLDGES